jgi:NADH:ubiquinone oxidoreductase subunit 6 (subunit J)
MSEPLLLVTSSIAALGALYAINARQLMRGVLGLAVFFIALAMLFAQLGAWYLAVGQLFLFVGGVVTLFVLAFNFVRTPIQHSGSFWPWMVSMLALLSLALFLPFSFATPQGISLTTFAAEMFLQYGWILNLALLLLFSAIITSQYLLEDT